MTYPYNLETKTISGSFVDSYIDRVTGEVKTRPRRGYIYITPFHSRVIVQPENVSLSLYELQNQRIRVEGDFSVELLVTDQPRISPSGWTYKFTASWLEDWEVNIPITADLPDVIDLNDWINEPEDPGVVINRGAPGRGIEGITSNGLTATVTYTDGTTSNFQLPDPEGGNQYIWSQSSALADWTINHNLNRYITACFVTYGADIADPTADQIMVPWTNVDKNTIVIHHGAACSGQAVLI